MDKQRALKRAQSFWEQTSHVACVLKESAGLNYLATGVLAFVLSSATLASQMAPFGVAYSASRKSDGQAIFASVGAFLGYLLLHGIDGMGYGAAVILCLASYLVFKGHKAAWMNVFMPGCVLGAMFFTRLPFCLGSGRAFALLLCESILSCGLCYFFSFSLNGKQTKNKVPGLIGATALFLSLMLSIMPWQILGLISPARVAVAVLVMMFAYWGGTGAATAAGVLLGAGVDLSAGLGPFFTATYGLSALLSSFCAKQGKLFFTLCYVIGNGVVCLWTGDDFRAGANMYECLIATVIFYLLPQYVEERCQGLLSVQQARESRPPQRLAAVQRLQAVSQAVEELGNTLSGFVESLRQKEDDGFSGVFQRAAENICRRCPVSGSCWDRDYINTFGALNDVTEKLKVKNSLDPWDFPRHFASRCMNIKGFCGSVNEEYAALLRRRAQRRRDLSARELMKEQYSGLKGVLDDVAGSLNTYPEHYPQLETQISRIAKAYARQAGVAVYAENGRMYVEVTGGTENHPLPDEEAFVRSVSNTLGREFLPPQMIPTSKGYMLRLRERENYQVSVSCAIRKKHGEEVCGDTSMHFRTDDGRAIIMLSDGMGTGTEAASLSQSALKLISHFVKSGCSLSESAKAVLPVLSARFEQHGFVTLDLLEINLFTGQARMLKYGAATSFVQRQGKLGRIVSEAMPAGAPQILTTSPEPVCFKLGDGDRVIMLSDGVYDADDGWLEEEMKQNDRDDAQSLTSSIIARACERGGIDDMSAMVINLTRKGYVCSESA